MKYYIETKGNAHRAYCRKANFCHRQNSLLALKALFGLLALARVYSKRVERYRSTLLFLLPQVTPLAAAAA